jgi:hypothetical protein
MKAGANGNLLWTKTYSDGTAWLSGWAIQQTRDSSFTIAASVYRSATQSDVYIVKTDMMGAVHWTSQHGGSGYEWPSSVQQTSDGGFVVAGRSNSNLSSYDFYLLKTDEMGVVSIVNDPPHFS